LAGFLIRQFVSLIWNFRFWHFQHDFASGLVSGELPVSPLVFSLSLFFSLSVFLYFFVWSLLWGLLLASSVAESSRCSGIAAETQFVGWCLSLAFTHCRELMKSVGKL
jgi:hypothetical protein